ncbi:MAG: hypothetical protein ACI4GO_08455 [Hominenteromicrobium sp.]
MELPKLTFPPKTYSVSDSIKDQKRTSSFAWKLSAEIAAHDRKSWIDAQNAVNKKKLMPDACKKVNEHYKRIRGQIDQGMQAYILEHDGQIDSWADSAGETVLRHQDVESAAFVFDYFGEDYVDSSSGKAARKSSGLVYRNEYRFPGTEQYNKLEPEWERLNESVKKAKAGCAALSGLLSLIGAVYLLFGIVSVLGDILFGFGRVLDPIIEASDISMSISLIAALPYILYALIVGIAGEVSDPMAIFCIVLLLGACLIGMLFCFSFFKSYRKDAKALKRAKNELHQFMVSTDFKRIAAENEALCKKNEDLAEQWHRAWYRWVCSIKDAAKVAPKETYEIIMDAFSSDFEKKVASADLNALIKKEKEKNKR